MKDFFGKKITLPLIDLEVPLWAAVGAAVLILIVMVATGDPPGEGSDWVSQTGDS